MNIIRCNEYFQGIRNMFSVVQNTHFFLLNYAQKHRFAKFCHLYLYISKKRINLLSYSTQLKACTQEFHEKHTYQRKLVDVVILNVHNISMLENFSQLFKLLCRAAHNSECLYLILPSVVRAQQASDQALLVQKKK